MGIDANSLKLLFHAKIIGVSFAHMATIGRQGLLISKEQLCEIFENNSLDMENVDSILSESRGFADSLFEKLGANEVCSFDNSEYEGASEIIDFNLSIPKRFKGKFSLVLDGGALEHVFNLPVALKNCMEMVAVGGHLITITTGNNFLGHGFYQFSPELFYRAFSNENGFSVCKMFLYEDVIGDVWHEVVDPKDVSERVTLVNSRPTFIAVIAQRKASVEVFSEFPSQSDYETIWEKSATSGTKSIENPVCSWSKNNNNPKTKVIPEPILVDNPIDTRSLLRKILHRSLQFLRRVSRLFDYDIVRIQTSERTKSPYRSDHFKAVNPNNLDNK